jgi:anti-sigma-K factor RskA
MSSEHIQLLIAGYILGNLDAEEAAEFEQLLAKDPAIATDLAEMQQTLEFSYNPTEVQPPDHLRTLVLQGKAQPVAQPALSFSTRSFDWNKAIGVAAAAAIVILGINNYRLWSTLQATQPVPQPSQPELKRLTYVLQGTQSKAAAATIIVNPNTLKASLTVQSLPLLPSGKTYVLWTVLKPEAPFTKDSKAAILTKVFQVDDRGNTSQTITVPEVYRSKDLVVNVAVTVEDAAMPQNHVGDPVLIAKL